MEKEYWQKRRLLEFSGGLRGSSPVTTNEICPHRQINPLELWFTLACGYVRLKCEEINYVELKCRIFHEILFPLYFT